MKVENVIRSVRTMISSVTGSYCTIDESYDKSITRLVADYSCIEDKDVIAALWASIEGRLGDKLVDITDHPDEQMLVVRIKADNISEEGDLYARKLKEVRALKVTKDNLARLKAFVGNGEMMDDGDRVCFEFHNGRKQRIRLTAYEGDYIVRNEEKDSYEVWTAYSFVRNYERK